MDGWLCKIWNFFSKLFKAIVDLIVDMVRSIADAVLDLVSDVFGTSGLGSWLIIGALAVAGYYAWGAISKKNKENELLEAQAEAIRNGGAVPEAVGDAQ